MLNLVARKETARLVKVKQTYRPQLPLTFIMGVNVTHARFQYNSSGANLVKPALPLNLLHPLHIFPSVVTETKFEVAVAVAYSCIPLNLFTFTASTKYDIIAS
jgi:hypothetical protein